MSVSLSSGHELSSQAEVMFTADRHHSLRTSSSFPFFLHSGDRFTVLPRLALDFAAFLPQSQRARMADLHHPNTCSHSPAGPAGGCICSATNCVQPPSPGLHRACGGWRWGWASSKRLKLPLAGPALARIGSLCLGAEQEGTLFMTQ